MKYLTTTNNLADAYRKLDKQDVAEELYKDVLTMRTQILGAEHPAVAQTLHSMAQLFYNQGQYAFAEDMYTKALKIYEKALGPEHPSAVQILIDLALLYDRKLQRHDLAKALVQRAGAIHKKSKGTRLS